MTRSGCRNYDEDTILGKGDISDMRSILIIGCGYVGRRVAQVERKRGNRVVALARSTESAGQLTARGIEAVRGDLDVPSSLTGLPTQDAIVYYFAPPPSSGTIDPRIQNFLDAIPENARPSRVVLISTSGVYGNCQGEWVTEDRAPRPVADRARRRLDAERRLGTWCENHFTDGVILRVPGIYGPGRLPRKRLLAQEPVLLEQESPWSNRIHVDDLVRACHAAAHHARPGTVYNISDGHPSTMTDYFNRVADAINLPRPPQITLAEAQARLSDTMQSYLAESKRLDNRRMRQDLGVEPLYPDLSQGLRACLAAEATKGD
jgi:nucleoside-diphosphate-sugar epimerase